MYWSLMSDMEHIGLSGLGIIVDCVMRMVQYVAVSNLAMLIRLLIETCQWLGRSGTK